MNKVAYIGEFDFFDKIKGFFPNHIILTYYDNIDMLKNRKIDLLLYSIKSYNKIDNLSTEYREYLGLTHISIFYIIDNKEDRKLKLRSSLDDYIIKPFFPEYMKSRVVARLEMKKLSDKVRIMIKEQMSILDLSEIFSSDFSYKKSLSILSKKLSKIFKTDMLSILVVDNEQFKVVADARVEYQVFKDIFLDPIKYPEIKEALRTKKIFYIDDITEYEPLNNYKGLILKRNIKAILILPIIYNGEVLGVISVKFLKSRYKFYKNIVNYSMIITNTTAIALKNAEMLESARMKNNALIKNQEMAKFSHLYTEVLSKANIPMLIIDDKGNIVFLNNYIERVLPYNSYELFKINFFALVKIKQQRELLIMKIKELSRTDNFFIRLELRMVTDTARFGLKISYFKDNHYIIEFDMNEQYRKKEKKLKSDIKFYENLLDLSDNAYIGIDQHGNIKMFNSGAQKVLGYTKKEAMKLKVWDIYPSFERAKDVGLAISNNNGRIEKFDTILLSKFKNKIEVQLDTFFLYDENEEKIGSVGVFKPKIIE